MFRYVIFSILLYSHALIASLAHDKMEKNNANVVIEELQAALIDVMKNADELGYSGRYAKLDPVIRSTHALSKIAKVAVGRHWRQLDGETKATFVDKFSEFCIANYAFYV